MTEDEKTKRSVKGILSLREDYELWDVLEAVVMEDTRKLSEIKARCTVLNDAYKKFVEEIDSGDKKLRATAMNTFTRPLKVV